MKIMKAESSEMTRLCSFGTCRVRSVRIVFPLHKCPLTGGRGWYKTWTLRLDLLLDFPSSIFRRPKKHELVNMHWIYSNLPLTFAGYVPSSYPSYLLMLYFLILCCFLHRVLRIWCIINVWDRSSGRGGCPSPNFGCESAAEARIPYTRHWKDTNSSALTDHAFHLAVVIYAQQF